MCAYWRDLGCQEKGSTMDAGPALCFTAQSMLGVSWHWTPGSVSMATGASSCHRQNPALTKVLAALPPIPPVSPQAGCIHYIFLPWFLSVWPSHFSSPGASPQPLPFSSTLSHEWSQIMRQRLQCFTYLLNRVVNMVGQCLGSYAAFGAGRVGKVGDSGHQPWLWLHLCLPSQAGL